MAKLADALGLGPSGQPWGFESLYSHQISEMARTHETVLVMRQWRLPFLIQYAPMVESVDAGDSKSLAQKAWGFKSLSGHQSFQNTGTRLYGGATDF